MPQGNKTQIEITSIASCFVDAKNNYFTSGLGKDGKVYKWCTGRIEWVPLWKEGHKVENHVPVIISISASCEQARLSPAIFGLSEDNKIYEWSERGGEWVLNFY